jgi:hypothetical protein
LNTLWHAPLFGVRRPAAALAPLGASFLALLGVSFLARFVSFLVTLDASLFEATG